MASEFILGLKIPYFSF